MRRVFLHVLFWLVYVFTLAYLNVTSGVKSFELLPEGALLLFYSQVIIQTIFLLVKIPFVYTALFLLDQYLNQKRKLFPIVGILTILITAGAISMSLLNHHLILPYLLNMYENEYSVFSTGSLLYHGLALAFITGIATTIKLMRWQYQTQLQVVKLQRQMIEAELKYLKGQINPHFLFNTLNNIYSLARKGSSAAAESILKLSKLMRFMLFETGNARILLKNEIALIEDYIELERLRYTNRLHIDFKNDLDKSDQEIAPLLLIHFVENAFKHGISETHQNSFVSIDIKLKEGILDVQIANSIQPTTGKSNGSKIGLENVRRQLELIYPNHRLEVLNTSDTFKVTLIIPLS